jgi:hypothetical protein
MGFTIFPFVRDDNKRLSPHDVFYVIQMVVEESTIKV